jgi:hypothetical protein
MIEHECTKYGYKLLIQKLYREFMILGFISFGTYIIDDQLSYDENNPWYKAFHFAHIVILFIALSFIVQAALFIVLISTRNKLLRHYGSSCSSYLLKQYHQLADSYHHRKRWLDCWRYSFFHYGPCLVPYPQLRENIEFKIIQQFFIYTYNLPMEFNFGSYSGETLKHYVIQLVHVRPITWLLLAGLVGVNYLRLYCLDGSVQDDICHHDVKKCLDYMLLYALLCITAISLSLIGLLIASEIYYRRLIDIVLDQEEFLESLTKEQDASNETPETALQRHEPVLNAASMSPRQPMIRQDSESTIERDDSDAGFSFDGLIFQRQASRYIGRQRRGSISSVMSDDYHVNTLTSYRAELSLQSLQEWRKNRNRNSAISQPAHVHRRSSATINMDSGSIQLPRGRLDSNVAVDGNAAVVAAAALDSKFFAMMTSSYDYLQQAHTGRRYLYVRCIERICEAERAYQQRLPEPSTAEPPNDQDVDRPSTSAEEQMNQASMTLQIAESTSSLQLNDIEAHHTKSSNGLHVDQRSSSMDDLKTVRTQSDNNLIFQSYNKPRQTATTINSEYISQTPVKYAQYFEIGHDRESEGGSVCRSDNNNNISASRSPHLAICSMMIGVLVEIIQVVMMMVAYLILGAMVFVYRSLMADDVIVDVDEGHHYERSITEIIMSLQWWKTSPTAAAASGSDHHQHAQHQTAFSIQKELKTIFWLHEPKIFYQLIELILLLQCFYVSFWCTNLLHYATASAHPVAWSFALTMPMAANFFILRSILSTSGFIHSVIYLNGKISDRICEEAYDERNILIRLRKIVHTSLSQIIDNESLIERYDHLLRLYHVVCAENKDQDPHRQRGQKRRMLVETPILQRILSSLTSSHQTQQLAHESSSSREKQSDYHQINAHQFNRLLHALQIRLTSRSIEKIFSVLDKEKDGLISWYSLSLAIFPTMHDETNRDQDTYPIPSSSAADSCAIYNHYSPERSDRIIKEENMMTRRKEMQSLDLYIKDGNFLSNDWMAPSISKDVY